MPYDLEREYADRALDAENGLEITCATEGAAVSLVQRLNKFRLAERKANAGLPFDDPWRGRSAYDNLSFARRGSRVMITRRQNQVIEVREIPVREP